MSEDDCPDRLQPDEEPFPNRIRVSAEKSGKIGIVLKNLRELAKLHTGSQRQQRGRGQKDAVIVPVPTKARPQQTLRVKSRTVALILTAPP